MKTLHDTEEAVLKFDEEKSTLVFIWRGVVSEATVIRVFKQAANASLMTESLHWLIDRRELEEYEAEARIWIKNDFIHKYGKELIQKTDKMAAVLSDNAMAEVASRVLVDLILEQNPGIEFQEFDMVTPASNWLSGKKEEEPERKRGFFRRR